METYKQKVIKHYRKLKKKGLIRLNFYFTEEAKRANEEEIYEEIWRMINAPDLPDKEVLGKYSL